MEKVEIMLQLQDIFRDIFENEEIVLSESLTSDDIEEWDSLSHVILVVEIEKHFNIKFMSKEVMEWTNVGDMLNSIELKIVR